MNEKQEVINLIKEAYRQVNANILTTDGYEIIMDALCEQYGTEYVAGAFVELTKAGAL